MRDRLIELLEAECGFSRYMTDDERRARLADHLLAEGVIVPKFKRGQLFYGAYGGRYGIPEGEVEAIMLQDLTGTQTEEKIYYVYNMDYQGYDSFTDEDIGVTIFATPEEAKLKYERRKAERSENGT